MTTTAKRTQQLKREVLNRRIAELSEEYIFLNDQLDYTSNSGEKRKLKKQIKQIEQQIDEAEAELKEIEGSEVNPNRRYLTFQEDLPKIDFQEAMKVVERIFSQSSSQDNTVPPLLLTNSFRMAGSYCIDSIYQLLSSKTGDLKYYPVEFSSETGLDEWALLTRLAGHVGVAPEQDINTLVNSIIQKICESVRGGTIVYLEIRRWDDLPNQGKMLSWFIQSFWIRLLNQREVIRRDYAGVRFVSTIVAISKLSDECAAFVCSTSENELDGTKLVQLPLRNWTEDEIRQWLEVYPGLPVTRSREIAKRAYEVSDHGVPRSVVTFLLDESKYFS